MKKILLAVLATAMVVGLGSCGAGGRTFYTVAESVCTEMTNSDADGLQYLEKTYKEGTCPAEFGGKSCTWTDSSSIYGDTSYEMISKADAAGDAALKITCDAKKATIK